VRLRSAEHEPEKKGSVERTETPLVDVTRPGRAPVEVLEVAVEAFERVVGATTEVTVLLVVGAAEEVGVADVEVTG